MAQGDCPFCNSPHVEPFSDMDSTDTFSRNVYIKCTECGARGPDLEVTGTEAQNWNPPYEPTPYLIRQAWDAWSRRGDE